MFTYNGEDEFGGMENEAQLLLLKIAKVYQLQFPNIDQLKILPKNVDDHNEYLVDAADRDLLLGKLSKTLRVGIDNRVIFMEDHVPQRQFRSLST